MRQVYPVIFTPLNDKKNTVLIEVPDWEILTEGYGMADAVEMARDAIGLKGITYEDNVLPRDDISVIKCGLHIPNGMQDYTEFTEHMKENENAFRQKILQN